MAVGASAIVFGGVVMTNHYNAELASAAAESQFAITTCGSPLPPHVRRVDGHNYRVTTADDTRVSLCTAAPVATTRRLRTAVNVSWFCIDVQGRDHSFNIKLPSGDAATVIVSSGGRTARACLAS
jgi:hypothetical protein